MINNYFSTEDALKGQREPLLDTRKSVDFIAYEETLPELYKDVKYKDSENRVWYPISINVSDKGTVFLNGKSVENTFWSAIKVVELTEEEKQQPKFKGLAYKSDAKSLKNFENDFIEAIDYIGLFEKQ